MKFIKEVFYFMKWWVSDIISKISLVAMTAIIGSIALFDIMVESSNSPATISLKISLYTFLLCLVILILIFVYHFIILPKWKEYNRVKKSTFDTLKEDRFTRDR